MEKGDWPWSVVDQIERVPARQNQRGPAVEIMSERSPTSEATGPDPQSGDDWDKDTGSTISDRSREDATHPDATHPEDVNQLREWRLLPGHAVVLSGRRPQIGPCHGF